MLSYKILLASPSGNSVRTAAAALSLDRVEVKGWGSVTVPNAVMGNTKIINESGGRHEKFRIRVQVGVAYGSDIDLVREILQQIGEAETSTCGDPEPRVRFRRFGPSALEFELLCWISQPVLRGRILDKLNCSVYKAFLEAGIEIPYSKHDIYIKSMPAKDAK